MLSDYWEHRIRISNRIRRGIRRYDYRSGAVSYGPAPSLLIRGAHDREINLSNLAQRLAAHGGQAELSFLADQQEGHP